MDEDLVKMRYVGGGEAGIMDTPFVFRAFGQLVEMPGTLAKHAMCNRVPLIPVADFEAIGFTPDELRRYSRFATHETAPPDFIEKRNRAWAVYLDTVDALRKDT